MPNADLSTSRDLHDHVLAWLRANEIDPSEIPADPHMTLVGDQLTTDVKVRNEHGKQQFDPGMNAIARTTKTFTVAVAPPADVADWLLPRCPTCGR